jgi:hypothetical protein
VFRIPGKHLFVILIDSWSKSTVFAGLHLVQDPSGLIIQRIFPPSLFLIVREIFANGRSYARVAPGDVILEHSGYWLCDAATASIHKLSTHSDLVIAGVVTTD